MYDALIVGMGPVGLAAAYELANQGIKVLIVEKRPENEIALRSQLIVLSPATKQQLIDMIQYQEPLSENDIKFLDDLAFSFEAKIRNIQDFILNRIKNLNKTKKMPNNIENTPPIDIKYETNIESIDLGKGEAKIKGEVIQFKHLVAADGANSETLKLVNNNLNKEQMISHDIPSGTKYLEYIYHLGAYVKLSRVDGKEFEVPKREFVSSFLKNKTNNKLYGKHQLYFLRFDLKSHSKMNKKMMNLGFLGEIPEDFYSDCKKLTSMEEKHHYALPYIKRAAADYLGVNEEEINITIPANKKNKLKLVVFKGKSRQASKAAIEVNNHGFYLAGDAYFAPHYAIGHGLNDGFEAAKALSKLPQVTGNIGIAQFKQHIADYNEESKKRSKFAKRSMLGIHLMRKLGKRMKVSESLENAIDMRERKFKIDLKNSLIKTGINNSDVISQFIKNSKFKVLRVKRLIDNGSDNYEIGFLSLNKNNLDGIENQLKEISQSNDGIPIIVKIHDPATMQYQYRIYGRNKQGDWQLTSCNNKFIDDVIGGASDLFKTQLNTTLNNQAISSDLKHLIISYVTSNYYQREQFHYQNQDRELRGLIKEWKAFLVSNPSIAKQYSVEIWSQILEMEDLIKNYPNELIQKEFYDLCKYYKGKIDKYNQELINLANINPNKPDPAGFSPLYYAVQYGNLDTIEAVLALGADPDKAVKNGTLFTKRVLYDITVSRKLFEHDAFIPNKHFFNILSIFTECGIEYLIACNNPNSLLYKKIRQEFPGMPKNPILIHSEVYKLNLNQAKDQLERIKSNFELWLDKNQNKASDALISLPNKSIKDMTYAETLTALEIYIMASLDVIKSDHEALLRRNSPKAKITNLTASLFKKRTPKNDRQFIQNNENFSPPGHGKSKKSG